MTPADRDRGGDVTAGEEAVDALLATVDDGGRVDCDGLVADRTEDGYEFTVPGATAAGLSEREFRDLARAHGAYVAEWAVWTRQVPLDPARRAFLRWIEDADDRAPPERHDALRDGVAQTWGEVRIAVSLDAADRRTYDLRHRADADAPVTDLAVHETPGAATDLVRSDETGEYRPLKTAPTLPAGWVFPDLDGAALVRTVDNVYPGTIANWHREREGRLDVTHWRETAERQTGIYDVVDELAGQQVEWLAQACCVDSQCLKRRAWDESEDEPLDVPRGDGEFPCREPCSLVVAAAREVALAERAESDGVTLELTPTERDQLSRIVDAVATGEADSIRDGDLGDGANRLRARYLRAKLSGDEGILATEDGDHGES